MTVSIADQLKCARRELAMRERVYPRRVADGKMTPQKSAEEMAAMAAIIETLERLEQGERLL